MRISDDGRSALPVRVLRARINLHGRGTQKKWFNEKFSKECRQLSDNHVNLGPFASKINRKRVGKYRRVWRFHCKLRVRTTFLVGMGFLGFSDSIRLFHGNADFTPLESYSPQTYFLWLVNSWLTRRPVRAG
jgi:hypothetical protein